MEKKEKIIDAVLEQIKVDIAEGDLTAIAELLTFTPTTNLIGFLPETEEYSKEELAFYAKDELEKRMAKVVDDFSNTVNNFRYNENAEAFYKAFRSQHRTLQQSMMRTMLAVIEKVATDETYGTDARNADTRKICTNLLDSFDKGATEQYGKSNQPYLPSKFLGTV